MLHAIDLRDWQGVRDAFADHVDIDYSSLFGAPAATVSSDEHVGGWRAFGNAFDVTQHFIGPVIETAENRHECNVRGYHYLDDETWMVAGWYVLTTTTEPGESIMLDGITLIVSYETGSRSLIERAQERVAAPTHPQRRRSRSVVGAKDPPEVADVLETHLNGDLVDRDGWIPSEHRTRPLHAARRHVAMRGHPDRGAEGPGEVERAQMRGVGEVAE